MLGSERGWPATPPAGTFSQVSAGGQHTCGLETDATLACWGANGFGQAAPPAGTFNRVSAGYEHTCALRTSGYWTCWGANSHGQLNAYRVYLPLGLRDSSFPPLPGPSKGTKTDGTRIP